MIGLPEMRGYEQSLPLLLLKAREAVMARFLPLLRAENLSAEQWRVIRALIEADELDATTLSERCVLMPPSLSRMLGSLERRGLIARRRDPADQRRWLISISGRGRALFSRLAPQSELAYAEIESRLGPERLERMYAILNESIERLDNGVAARRGAESP